MSDRTGGPVETLETTTASPNEQVFLTIRGNDDVSLRLAPGYYARASAEQLRTSLVAAARLAVVDRTRALYDAYSRESGRLERPGADRSDPESRAYREGLDRLLAVGEALDGRLRLTCAGLGEFSGYLDPTVPGSVPEAEFVAACERLARDLIQDQWRQVRALKFEVYYRPELERRGVIAS